MAISPAMHEMRDVRQQEANAKAAMAMSTQMLKGTNGPSSTAASDSTNIAEQLDEQERRKYVKGAHLFTPHPTNHFH